MEDIWTIQKTLNWTIEYFTKKEISEPRLSAELLLAAVLKCKRMDLYVQFERILEAGELATYRGMIQRRTKHEPVQYIIGEQEFMGFRFQVSPDVLIPRFDTEILVESAVQELEHLEGSAQILDVGTGSGAIAISLAKLLPNATVQAIDISEKAVKAAERNAAGLGAENVSFRVQDALELTADTLGKFDCIVSNPPYIAEQIKAELDKQVTEFEPGQALFAGKDGLDFYRAFIPVLPKLLNPGGLIFFEIGYDQSSAVSELLKEHGFNTINYIKDFQQHIRVIKANL